MPLRKKPEPTNQYRIEEAIKHTHRITHRHAYTQTDIQVCVCLLPLPAESPCKHKRPELQAPCIMSLVQRHRQTAYRRPSQGLQQSSTLDLHHHADAWAG